MSIPIKASVVPYYDELENYGIRLHKESEDQICMKKLDWPRHRGHRQPTSGSDDAIHTNEISISWRHDKLWTKNSKETSLEAKRLSEEEFSFFGYFYAQLDGDIAYVPKNDEYDFLMIFCEKEKQDNHRVFHAVRFPKGSTVQIDPFVIHSIPIPVMVNDEEDAFNVTIYHRAVNAKSHFMAPNSIIVHSFNVERKIFVPLRDEPHIDESREPVLPWRFTSKNGTLKLEPAEAYNFAEYGQLIHNFEHHKEQVKPAHWPYLKKHERNSRVGPLEQDFRLFWNKNTHSNKKNLHFTGLSGTYDGKEGCPGIEHDLETGEYIVNILTTRPDGSYYLHAKNQHTKFAMAFALHDNLNGDPVVDTLKVFMFKNGQAIRLSAGVWHSLPIPLDQNEAEFREVVCETNAIIDINLPYECGSGLKFKNELKI